MHTYNDICIMPLLLHLVFIKIFLLIVYIRCFTNLILFIHACVMVKVLRIVRIEPIDEGYSGRR